MRVACLIFLCGLILPQVSWADVESTCNSVDLSHSVGFSNREITNQQDIGWCYAFSMADLLSQKTGQPVSAFDLAISYNAFVHNKFEDGHFEGGNASAMSEMLKQKKWVCGESDYGDFQAKAYLNYEAREYQRLHDISTAGTSDTNYVGSGLFKNIQNFSDVKELIEHSTSFSEYLTKLNDKNCRQRIEINVDLEVITQDFCGWNNEACQEPQAQYIRRQLNRAKMVYMSFDPTLLFTLGQGFWKTQLAHLRARDQHAATIVGKHEKNGKCFYLVHDSAFGIKESCQANKMSPEISCLDGSIYEVPEATVLNAINLTAVIKD